MRVNNKWHAPIHLHQENIKEVEKFIYLDSVYSKNEGTDNDISRVETKPGTPSATYAQSGDSQPCPNTTRSGSSTPT
jgi:hypothetical protein